MGFSRPECFIIASFHRYLRQYDASNAHANFDIRMGRGKGEGIPPQTHTSGNGARDEACDNDSSLPRLERLESNQGRRILSSSPPGLSRRIFRSGPSFLRVFPHLLLSVVRSAFGDIPLLLTETYLFEIALSVGGDIRCLPLSKTDCILLVFVTLLLIGFLNFHGYHLLSAETPASERPENPFVEREQGNESHIGGILSEKRSRILRGNRRFLQLRVRLLSRIEQRFISSRESSRCQIFLLVN